MNKQDLIRSVHVRSQIPLLFVPLDIRHIAEIGVWKGTFFRQLIKPASVELAVAVDAWNAEWLASGGSTQVTQAECDAMYEKMQQLAAGNQRVRIGVARGNSPEVAKYVDDEVFEFIYIDADHTYAGVMRDLVAWYPKLRVGGIFAGHDYFKHKYYVQYGVVQAVDEFRASNNLKFFHQTPDNCPNWFLIKGE